MSQGDSVEEKLVEEIVRRIIHQFGLVQGSITAHNLANRFITLTLKAVVDGMPLPGEVGRDRIIGWNGGIAVAGDLDIKVNIDDILVALRQEEEK